MYKNITPTLISGLVALLCFQPFSAVQAETREKGLRDEVGIHIIPDNFTVRDDSVRLGMEITVTGIHIPTEQSLTLLPTLCSEGKEVVLPPVVLLGRQRARFDKREERIAPKPKKQVPYHTWVGVRAEGTYRLRYETAVPYAAWMDHAGLRLRQVLRDCCDEQLLADDLLTDDIQLVSPCAGGRTEQTPVATLPKDTTETAPVKEQRAVTTPPAYRPEEYRRAVLALYIDYPRSGSTVDPAYGRNRYELQKVDSLLGRLLGNPLVTVGEIRITGYASPEGSYGENESLSRSRSLGFLSYLTKSYGLQDYPFRTAWVAEDWEGLRSLLKGEPYEKDALGIIDRYTVFDERERYLMQLEGGAAYRDMLHRLFPRLRRIEIIITYKNALQQ